MDLAPGVSMVMGRRASHRNAIHGVNTGVILQSVNIRFIYYKLLYDWHGLPSSLMLQQVVYIYACTFDKPPNTQFELVSIQAKSK